jgi:hypothetical protein
MMQNLAGLSRLVSPRSTKTIPGSTYHDHFSLPMPAGMHDSNNDLAL